VTILWTWGEYLHFSTITKLWRGRELSRTSSYPGSRRQDELYLKCCSMWAPRGVKLARPAASGFPISALLAMSERPTVT
jgi:hypothetical protein